MAACHAGVLRAHCKVMLRSASQMSLVAASSFGKFPRVLMIRLAAHHPFVANLDAEGVEEHDGEHRLERPRLPRCNFGDDAGRAAHASPVIVKPTVRLRAVYVMPCLPSFREAGTADENWHELKTDTQHLAKTGGCARLHAS